MSSSPLPTPPTATAQSLPGRSNSWRVEAGDGEGVRHGLVLAVACLCQLMVVLDISVVNVALPSIRASLGFDPGNLSWVVNAYTLTFGGLLLLGGRIGDLIGHRCAALAGLLLFAATSLLGGLAQSSGQLIAARAVQGVAGALLLPVSLTIIAATFPEGQARQRALAVWAAVAGAGGALGVFLGGLLTQELDWRWVLFINVPVAAVAITLAHLSLRPGRRVHGNRIDIAGAVLVTLAMVSLVYAVVRTDQYPWGSAHTLIPLTIAVVALGAFVAVEQTSRAPLVRLAILRNRLLLVADIVIFIIACAQFASFYFASLYLQGVLGYSPLDTGLAFVPFSLGIIAGTVIAGRLVPRLGPRVPLVIGLVLAALGVAWFGKVSPHGTFTGDILGPSILASSGLGICFVAVASAATSGVAPHEAGLASGLLNTCRQCGGSIGLAVLATVANTVTRHRADSGTTTRVALTAGYDHSFIIAAILIAVGAAAAAIFLHSPGKTPRDPAHRPRQKQP